MNILGISCHYHDSAAALIRDGLLIAASEEERFSRKKHDHRFPELAIEFCLAEAGMRSEDLDYVVFHEKPLVKFERILMSVLGAYPATYRVFREAMVSWFNEKLWIKGHILKKVGVSQDRILFCEHHMSHASSALFCSSFDEAAIMTVDGVGEWTTTTLGRGRANWNSTGENRIELFEEIQFPNSLGLLYSAFTGFLGFEVNEGEYKVMGMAPYGEPRYLDQVYKLIDVNSDGSFRLNMDYFAFHKSTEHSFNSRFADLFGPPRRRDAEFFTATTHPLRDHPHWDDKVAEENQHYADVAASIQRVTEEVLLKMANHLHERTGLKKLCVAGGVMLNSVANGRILRETAFDDMFIQPAAGDAGAALGAALWAITFIAKAAAVCAGPLLLGKELQRQRGVEFLKANNISYELIDDQDRMLDRVVENLMQGKVFGWFKGRFEWGPRALGNRSILADPRRAEMKGIVNEKIKFREPFRPFAPVILDELTREYFDLPEAKNHHAARFMQFVTPIRADKQELIPAVNHQGTGRLQTIQRAVNPAYYGLVEKFGEATGVPVLLNTSYNLRGEPMVSTPANAFSTFSNSGLDMLVLENFLIKK